MDPYELGLHEFLVRTPGVGGCIKQSAEDFVVVEIDEEGRVVDPCLVEEALGDRRAWKPVLPGVQPLSALLGELSGSNSTVRSPAPSAQVRDGPERLAPTGSDGTQLRAPPVTHDNCFVEFRIRKRNLDSLSVRAELASAWGVKVKDIQVAGLKDCTALTAQRYTLLNRDPVSGEPQEVSHDSVTWFEQRAAERLPDGAVASSFRVVSRSLRPGLLNGNVFVINVRNVQASEATVVRQLRQLAQRGFVNYIGLQRFGRAGMRSDAVGRCLLQRDFVRATALVLERDGCSEIPEWAAAFRRHRDFDATLQLVPPHRWVERRLLQTMRAVRLEQPSASWAAVCRCAWLAVPFDYIQLCAHAYLDVCWNITASDVVRRGGRGAFTLPQPEAPVGRPSDTRIPIPGAPSEAEVLCESEEDALLTTSVVPRPGLNVAQFVPRGPSGALLRSYLDCDGLSCETLSLERAGESRDFAGLEDALPFPGSANADVSAEEVVVFDDKSDDCGTEGDDGDTGDGEDTEDPDTSSASAVERPTKRNRDDGALPVGKGANRPSHTHALDGSIRHVRAFAHDMHFALDGTTLRLCFTLLKGQYATCLVRELCDEKPRGEKIKPHIVFDSSSDDD